MTPDQIIKNAEEALRKEFVLIYNHKLKKYCLMETIDDVESFIRQTLRSAIEQVRKETVEECIKAMGEEKEFDEEGGWESHNARGYNQHRSEALKRLEEMR